MFPFNDRALTLNRRTPVPNPPINSQPPPNRFAWEIGLALSLKIVLLVGLWFLLFRWLGRPGQQTDITRHFAPKDQAIVSAPPLPLNFENKENRHVR